MTKILNDPGDFTKDMLAGFAKANAGLVQAQPGGVIRAAASRSDKVAVVIGGGSGHYPAFAGWVGIGLADAAVVGQVFSSPSTQQVVALSSAADGGAGVLLSYGNYPGDVLNFGAARDELAARGIRTRTIVVSDDIASAPFDERSSRRGAAGNLVVVKIAGAAAEAGYDLDDVARVAERINSRTYSLGVAFSGCTLPGADAPLFALPPGRMGVGLGVHGERGIAEEDLGTAADLAAMLVERVLEERPPGAVRAAVLLNGMGATTFEELFIVWNEAASLLESAGVQLVEPEVGELITSLDMAGLSLTIAWLDEELETLWRAPALGTAYRKGTVPETERARRTPTPTSHVVIPAASAESRELAGSLQAALAGAAAALAAHERELDELDAVAGNGDHGRVMARGARAAVAAGAKAHAGGAGAATLLLHAADAWSDKGGGTSGALWGAGLRGAARALSDEEVVPDALVGACRSAIESVTSYGNARPGDKTVIDAFLPFVESLADDVAVGLPPGAAWANAAAIAARAADDTAAMSPRLGRARTLASRALGHRDPGAVSFVVVVRSAMEHFA